MAGENVKKASQSTCDFNDIDSTVSMRKSQAAVAVLSLLRGEAAPHGLHQDQIMRQVLGASSSDVMDAIAVLLENGELYSTITEKHFAAT